MEKCLEDLAGPRRWRIVRRALRCAELDGAARENEESLFEEMEVPASHATLAVGDAGGGGAGGGVGIRDGEVEDGA